VRTVLVRPPGLISLPLWFVCGWLGLEGINPLTLYVEASEFSCISSNGSAPHVEADGEWLGRLPMRISLARDGLRILRPEGDGRN